MRQSTQTTCLGIKPSGRAGGGTNSAADAADDAPMVVQVAAALAQLPHYNLAGWLHPMAACRQQLGDALGFTAAVVWIKGDWTDAAQTHGLPGVTSKNFGCPFCDAEQCAFYASIEASLFS